MTNRKLLAMPIPFQHESAGSFLLRASSKNGMHKPSRLISRFYKGNPRPIKFTSLLSNGHYFRKLCKSLNIDEKLIEPLAPARNGVNFGADFIFYGLTVHRSAMRVKNPVICPLCISEKGYLKRSWDHKFVGICTTHDVMLLEHCPECSTPITWERKALNQCDCGCDFSDAHLIPADPFATKIIESIFNDHDEKRYDILIDFLMTLKSYYSAGTIFDNNLIALATLGLSEPRQLENNLYIEIMADMNVAHYYPRITMSDFLIAHTPEVQCVGENIIEQLFNNNEPIKETIDETDCIAIESVIKTFEINRKDVLKLIREQRLFGFKPKPSSPLLVTKKSINDLILKISSLSQPIPNSTLTTLKDFSEDNGESISSLIIQILDGSLIPFSYNYRKPLPLIKVPKPKKIEPPLVREVSLITPYDLSEFCGAPINTIRSAFQKSKEFSYFNEGKTFGTQRYIRQSDAREFANQYIPRICNKAKKNLMLARKISELKITNVGVSYRL